jgi:hypothetical protein
MKKQSSDEQRKDMTEKKQNRNARDGDGDGLVEDGTEFERPEGFIIGAIDGDGDGMVQDGTEWERPVEQASVIPQSKKTPKAEEESVAWSQDMSVSVSKLVFESLFERNSRSVGLTQLRLVELGYVSAGSDRRGWLSAGTKEALEQYAVDNKIEGAYNTDAVIRALFARTPVTVTG